jgi:hypothetical protein
MLLMSSTAGAIDQRTCAVRDDSAVRQLPAAISLAILGLILGLAAVLVARRLVGALVSPLSGGAILLVALAVESVITSYRCVSSSTEFSVPSTQYSSRRQGSLPPRAVFSLIIPGIAAFAMLASLTLRGTPAWGLFFSWLLLISAESIPWLLYYRPGLINVRWLQVLRPTIAPPIESAHNKIPRGLVQQFTRIRDGDRESIHALVKADVAAHDHLAVVHLSFCPPLAAPPQLSAYALNADDAEVRITQAETFGTRLEVRLPAAKETPRALLVEVLGSVTDPKAA